MYTTNKALWTVRLRDILPTSFLQFAYCMSP